MNISSRDCCDRHRNRWLFVAGRLKSKAPPAGNPQLGIAEFKITETATELHIAGVDAKGNVLGHIDVQRGQISLAPEWNEGTAADVVGRKFTIDVLGTTGEYQGGGIDSSAELARGPRGGGLDVPARQPRRARASAVGDQLQEEPTDRGPTEGRPATEQHQPATSSLATGRREERRGSERRRRRSVVHARRHLRVVHSQRAVLRICGGLRQRDKANLLHQRQCRLRQPYLGCGPTRRMPGQLRLGRYDAHQRRGRGHRHQHLQWSSVHGRQSNYLVDRLWR